MLDALYQDVRYALRHIRRSPGFAAAAILTLALGIGANTGMFTVLNALVIQRLPIKDPDGLIGVAGRNDRGQSRSTPIAAVDEIARDGPLDDVCGYNGGFLIAVEAGGAPAQAIAANVTGRCFATFGVAPLLGRPIVDADAPLSRPGNRVAVIGHRFWTRMFGADPSAVGRTIRVEGLELTVIGVMPLGFGGLEVDSGADLFVPFDTIFRAPANRRPLASNILGRLRPGVSLELATAQLQTRWPAVLEVAVPPTLPAVERADMRAARPTVRRMGTGLSTYRDRYAGPLTLVLGLTSLLLVLACVNLGGLLLTRLTARSTELAVRLALGGSRRRVAQQLLVESLLLSLSGAALAVPVSFLIVAPLASFIPKGYVERTITFTPDRVVLAVTALVGLTVGVLMSVLPIWAALRRRTSVQIIGTRTVVSAPNRWARALLVVQVALSVVLLVGAGLLVRSLYLLQHVDLGVRTAGILNAKLMPVPSGYRGLDQASYYPPLLEKLAAIPGVRSVGFARMFPRLTVETASQPIAFVGDSPVSVNGWLDATSPGFFETVGIPLLAGRLTSWADNGSARQVTVVSESLARALAPDGNILERHVRFGTLQGHQDIVIVGVVGNATQGNPRIVNAPVMYRPVLQMGAIPQNPNLVIAIDRDVATVVAGVRQVVQDAGHEYAHEIISLDGVFARAPASERMSATLAAAVGLAVIGVHGALAYAVSRRTREIGVRVAIGAAPSEVALTVLREGVAVVLIGVSVGLPLAYVAARGLSALLFGVSQADPFTFVGAAALFLVVGVAAGIMPAWRAARVDPIVALRAE
jgi:predicted permease